VRKKCVRIQFSHIFFFTLRNNPHKNKQRNKTMNEPISIKIDVTKLDKSAFHKGAKGIYATIIAWPTKDGQPDKFGNDGMVTQDLGKDRRLAGEKSAILGNFKAIGGVQTAKAAPAPAQDDSDEIPF
jgi:hypothetical protein